MSEKVTWRYSSDVAGGRATVTFEARKRFGRWRVKRLGSFESFDHAAAATEAEAMLILNYLDQESKFIRNGEADV